MQAVKNDTRYFTIVLEFKPQRNKYSKFSCESDMFTCPCVSMCSYYISINHFLGNTGSRKIYASL